MKKYIFYLAAAVTLGVTSCRKIEVDGETIVVPGDGNGNGGEAGKRVELKGYVSANTTLRKVDNNIITGKVYVKDGVTLTVEKGAVVKGSYAGADVAALIINRGGKIVAQGTQDEPIVFTSASPTPLSGDWGGIVICGKAAINAVTNNISGLYAPEGGIHNFTTGDAVAGSGDALVPTPVNDDSSGVLSFVRIEYAGYAFQPNMEINSLTMACVGSKTVIDHIQVAYAKDDAFEWFGGTVNCKYLIAYKTQDDDFDTDNGYSGSVQFGLIVRDSSIADVSKSEAFESDNDKTGSTLTPQTRAVFSNITMFGPLATLNNVGNSNYLGAAVQIRRNSSLSLFNSAIVGWSTGVLIDASTGRATDRNIEDGNLQMKGILIAGCKKPVGYSASGTPTGATEATMTDWFNLAANRNKVVATVNESSYIRPFDYTNYDFQPFGDKSPLVISGATYFNEPLLKARPFITQVDFLGAIAPSGEYASWFKGWTKF